MDRSVYDGRSAVWASTLCCLPNWMLRFWHVYLLMYSVHNTKSTYKDSIYLVIYLCVCLCTVMHSLSASCRNQMVAFTPCTQQVYFWEQTPTSYFLTASFFPPTVQYIQTQKNLSAQHVKFGFCTDLVLLDHTENNKQNKDFRFKHPFISPPTLCFCMTLNAFNMWWHNY